jgi:hypothetical protein
MVKALDVVYKSVTAALGLATVVVGVNLTMNMYRGISWHYEQKVRNNDKPINSYGRFVEEESMSGRAIFVDSMRSCR